MLLNEYFFVSRMKVRFLFWALLNHEFTVFFILARVIFVSFFTFSTTISDTQMTRTMTRSFTSVLPLHYSHVKTEKLANTPPRVIL
jgi:Na+/H+-dicarboxylate symporter